MRKVPTIERQWEKEHDTAWVFLSHSTQTTAWEVRQEKGGSESGRRRLKGQFLWDGDCPSHLRQELWQLIVEVMHRPEKCRFFAKLTDKRPTCSADKHAEYWHSDIKDLKHFLLEWGYLPQLVAQLLKFLQCNKNNTYWWVKTFISYLAGKQEVRWPHSHFSIFHKEKKQTCFFVHTFQRETKTKCSALVSRVSSILPEQIQFGWGQDCMSLGFELMENLGTSTFNLAVLFLTKITYWRVKNLVD